MIRNTSLALAMVLAIAATTVNASLLAVVDQAPGSNDPQALDWLENNLGVTGLILLSKENTPGGYEASSAVPEADWDLTMPNTRSGSWTIDNSSFVPKYWFVKFNGLIAIYSYMGPGSSPWSDSFNLDTQVALVSSGNSGTLYVPIVNAANEVQYAAGAYTANMGKPNVFAGVSHVSVYGMEGVIPEPGTLLIWGGLAAVAATVVCRRRATT